MDITRRHLIVLTAAAALGGCAGSGQDSTADEPVFFRGPVDAGALTDYRQDGIFARFRDSHGFFIVREADRLFAQSAICTHRACRIKATSDGFLCPCHGSTFTRDGQVTRGPARRDLPRFAVAEDARAHLIVHTDQTLLGDQVHGPNGFIAI